MSNKLSIFATLWHIPYLYEVSKTGHRFVFGTWPLEMFGKNNLFAINKERPLNFELEESRYNATKRIKGGEFDLILCMNELDLEFALKLTIPKIFCILDYPIEEAYISIEETRKRKVFFTDISNVLVGPESYISAWGLPKSESEKFIFIDTCVDHTEFYGYVGDEVSILVMGNYLNRKHFGLKELQYLCKDLPLKVIGWTADIISSPCSSFDEIRKSYKKHRIFLHLFKWPIIKVGYGMSYLEAMATGMPVVSLIHPDTLIKDGYNGFISGDLRYLREKIEILLSDIELSRELGSNSRKTVINLRNFDMFLEKWNKAFYMALK